MTEKWTTGKIFEALRARLPDGPRITSVTQAGDGLSNGTFIVHGLNLVLRLPSPQPLLPLAHPVLQQHRILSEVRVLSDRLPVPAVHFADDDGDILGDPFYLMERLPGLPWGDDKAPEWALHKNESFGASITSQALDALVALHTTPPLASLGTVLSIQEELLLWRKTVEDFAGNTVLDGFAILFDALPAPIAPSPCHGDARLGNMLWSNGKLTAVLDWELSVNGDPRWDLGWFLQLFHPSMPPVLGVPGFATPEEFVAHWEAGTGIPATDMNWFHAAARLKGACVIATGAQLWRTGVTTDQRYAVLVERLEPFSAGALELCRAAARLD